MNYLQSFGEEVKFKRYLHGVGDAGTRLLFKLVLKHTDLMRNWVDTHRDRDGRCVLNVCGEDCESVDHFV